ncbi:MAG: hemerythrin domain-containing protein [Acidobacteria bacterium]|nr:hemerythrin domain-containing protein [Acidobacteriota bacterium]
MTARQPDSEAATPSPEQWPDLSLLTRHIIDTHHRYVRTALPSITASLHQLVSQASASAPELMRVREIFVALGEELYAHMAKEEQILFPYIDELAGAKRQGSTPPPSPFGTIANPVRMMEEDHEQALEQVQRLRELTNDYSTPADGTADHRRCLSELAAFDADLQRHTTLENTVLFPRALDLEDGMA